MARQRPFRLYRRIALRSPWRWLVLPLAAWVILQISQPQPKADPFLLHDEHTISCTDPDIIDGDTFDCGGTRIRMAGIDAPEMPGHCRHGRKCTPGDPQQAADALQRLTRGAVACQPVDVDIYGRTVARCYTASTDLSCAMIALGFAVHRYRAIDCR